MRAVASRGAAGEHEGAACLIDRVRVAAAEADHREGGQRPRDEPRVAGPLRSLDGRDRVRLRDGDSLRAADHERQQLPQSHLHLGRGGRDAEPFLEVANRLRRRTRACLDLAQQEERLRAAPVGLGQGQCDLPSPRRVARRETVSSGAEGAATRVGGSAPRRRAPGQLAELGGVAHGPASARDAGRLFERTGDGLSRCPRGERDVAGPRDRIADEAREAAVQRPPPLRGRGAVDGRREQRMSEADIALVDLDRLGRHGGVEDVTADAGGVQQLDVGAAERGDRQQRVARRRVERGEPVADEPLERLRDAEDRSRVSPRRAPAQGPCQLEGEERIATGDLVHAVERHPRKGLAEPLSHQPVHRPQAERTDPQPLEAIVGHEVDAGRLAVRDDATGEKQSHVLRVQPANGERQRVGGRAVEPLDVVDGDDHFALPCEGSERAERRNPRRQRPRRLTLRVLQQQRNLERAAPRRRQQREQVGEHALEQVTEAGVREAALCLRGTGGEHTYATSRRGVDACEPERRLADPRRALDEKRSQTCARRGEELVERGELFVPPDDRSGHRSPSGRGSQRGR